LQRTRILSGIQFTTCFIEIFVVKTKPFVGSFVHVILTRQTCDQRSNRAAESKRRTLGNYFSERISYMFPISKCRGVLNLLFSLFFSFVFPSSARWQNPIFPTSKHVFFRILPSRCGSANASTEVVNRPRSRSPLHFDIGNI